MAEICFVLSPAQNRFFVEIVEALRGALGALGIQTSVSFTGFPPARPGIVWALLPPHEYVALEGEDALPGPDVLARTIYVCAEQPGSVHFDQNTVLARERPPGVLFDINARSVRLFHERGVAARHLELGYTPAWDRFASEPERDIDATFLGAQTAHRLECLRNAAPVLARRRCEIHLSDNSRPNSDASPSFLTGGGKRALLARSKVLLNVHQTDEPYFEWVRIIEAIHCGAAVVSEHSTDFAPLVPGVHFLAGRAQSLPYLVDALLQHEARRHAMATAAYNLLRTELPMSMGAAALRDAAEELASQPPRSPDPARLPRWNSGPQRESAPAPMPHAYAAASNREQSLVRRNLSNMRQDVFDLRRRIARIEAIQRSPTGEPPPRTRIVAASAAWAAAQPQVTVVVPLHNQRRYVVEALDSVARSIGHRQSEVVVINDASSDGGADTVQSWMAEHPDLGCILVEHPINRGLAAARNTGLDFARGRYCMMLDADNSLYPACIARLAATLDWNPKLTFAYCILECFGHIEGYLQRGGMPMINVLGWEPERLRYGNFVDAMSMIRRDALRDIGGYAADSRLYGFEDYDLWCSIAERGWYGMQVPEILGRYRTSASSMGGLMDLSVTESVGAIVERHPRLMRGVQIPA